MLSNHTPHITLAWWNVQNLFSCSESKLATAFGFSSKRGWNESAYQQKLASLAQGIKTFCHDGFPDLLALCEIQSRSVLHDLINAIGYKNYQVFCYEDGDIDGIDTAFLYDASTLTPKGKPIGHDIYTRHKTHDLLEATFQVNDTNEEFTVIANHWPSRRAGRILTEPFRIAVADFCSTVVAKHLKLDEDDFISIENKDERRKRIEQKSRNNLIIIGDFNDEPFDRSVREYLKSVPNKELVLKSIATTRNLKYSAYERVQPYLYNPTWELINKPKPGTYYYSQLVTKWAFLDQVMVSRGLIENSGLTYVDGSLRVIRNKSVSSKSGIPLSFSFKGKVKGTSDHLPFVFQLKCLSSDA